MQRTLGRAHQRLKGEHPRRSPTVSGRAMEYFCDGLLILAGVSFFAGLSVAVWSFIGGFSVIRLLAGGALLAASVGLLFLWERLAWEPLGKMFSQLS